jgi:hypothetical protein
VKEVLVTFAILKKDTTPKKLFHNYFWRIILKDLPFLISFSAERVSWGVSSPSRSNFLSCPNLEIYGLLSSKKDFKCSSVKMDPLLSSFNHGYEKVIYL